MGIRLEVLSTKEIHFLVFTSSKIPTIYTWPKIHKNSINPPARPFVNSIDSISSRMGQYLQKSVGMTQSYLKDTKDFLNCLQSINLEGGGQQVLLLTADVSSLYSIIQHEDVLLALNWALIQRDDLPHNQKVFIGHALDFCLSHNYFWYANRFYAQQRGVAMGAKFAPNIKNLFMAEWEDFWVIFKERRAELFFNKRFIDDLFFISAGLVDLLQHFF